MKRKPLQRLLNISFHSIFWLWNLTFLAVVYCGILPFVGISLVVATFDGDVPVDFFLTFVALIGVPTVCTIIGAWRLRQQPRELMRLFYGVEAPLFVLCLIRLFLIRELTSASTLVLGTVVVCIIAFGVEVLRGYQANRQALAWLQMVAHTLMLLVGVYVGVLLLFYAVPAAGALLGEFFKFYWLEVLWSSLIYGGFIGFLFLLLVGFTSTLFVGMPSAFAALYLHSGQRILRAFAGQYGRNRTIGGGLAVLAIWMILFVSFSVQPQVQAFELLNKLPQTDSDSEALLRSADRQALLAKSEVIRTGLVNANLYPYRYLAVKDDNNHIYLMYKSVFNLPDAICQFLQNRYNQVMSPFLYDGDAQDVERSAKLYAEFFDTPLQKAERQAVQHALQSTAIIDEAKAGLLNIDQKRVWLRSQEVTVNPHGDWADVEIYEVYENKTPDVEEVLYYFSLPESAVITGVWLGDTNNRDLRFPFQVSPRGAAQQVYNSQVRRERPIDPALLEQVGPQNYRLRAFPVPPPLTSREKRDGSERATQMHLWLTYKVMRQADGWALPRLVEKRNIFWTNRTQRLRNGEVQSRFSDTWLEPFLPTNNSSPPVLHQANLTGGYRISAQPLNNQNVSLPSGKRFAVILDSSRSMATHRKDVAEAFRWLKQQGFADNQFANNDADLYITDSMADKPQRFDDISRFEVEQMTFYGSIQPQEMLQQFAQLRGDTPYDGILLLTDEGSYELSEDEGTIPEMTAPLWMVHLGENMPSAYEDTILKAMENSKGGVAADIPTVIQRMATQEALGSSGVSVVDGYAWLMAKGTPTATSKTGFEPLAARQLVLGLSQKKNGSSNPSLAELDAIHEVAKTFDIVTPYSSMIVLVNDEQRQMLKEAEVASDRFEREVETGQEQLNQPFDALTVSGTPEPDEWMLIGIGAIALLLVVRRQFYAARAFR